MRLLERGYRMDEQWSNIINHLKINTSDLHTVPKSHRVPLWFFADTDGTYIYVSSAKSHTPSSQIAGIRKLTYVEFKRIYPIYLRREQGEPVSTKATKVTVNQVYWYGIFAFCGLTPNNKSLYHGNNCNILNDEILKPQDVEIVVPKSMSCSPNKINVLGYEFKFVQNLIPECDSSDRVKKYCPQKYYKNIKKLPLSIYGDGSFCKFSINYSNAPGVYLWVVEKEIIYIGETSNLNRRFNQGYGTICSRNCFVGGQNTNCKMNKVVLSFYENGKKIELYFHETYDYKKIELELLRNIKTSFNVKDN